MVFFLLFGFFVICTGLLMLFAPEKLKKLNDMLNKPVFNDSEIFKNRVVFAIVLLAVGLLLIFTYLQYAF